MGSTLLDLQQKSCILKYMSFEADTNMEPAIAAAMPSARHIPALDGVRGVAVLLVMFLHYCGLKSGNPSALFQQITKIASIGQSGVDLFFVLSGFLITGILLESKLSRHFFRDFYVRRILRVFPLYYGFLIVIYLIGPLLHLWAPAPKHDQVWFWTYLQNLPMTFTQRSLAGPAHFWSLSVEEHFYLFWPFLIRRVDAPALRRVLFALVGLSVASRVVLIHLGYGTFYFTLCRLDGLSIGALLALAYRTERGLKRLRPLAVFALGTLTIVMPPLYVLTTGKGLDVIQIFKETLVAIMCAAGMVLALSPAGILKKLLEIGVLRSIGKYSYGMYVLHPSIFTAYAHHVNLASPALGMAVAFGGVYGICAAVWHLWERPFLHLKGRFSRVESRPSPLATA
jgi:peptidoglycan/LPS O-acetylase OafA/YrhL